MTEQSLYSDLKCMAFLLVQESLLEILFFDIDVYSSSLVLELALNSAQYKFSAIRRQTTMTAIPSCSKIRLR